ncbi:MAG: response regulator transcription factor, partial [Clostridium sp.]|nr:response regulator transcription factor [Clostridium sp.]
GYTPYSAFSLKDARDYLNVNLPDLILLDLNLPDGDGFQLCKEINLNNSIPIIILTAKSDIVDKVLGLELGADDYITKPFHIKEVISRIRAIFRRIEKTTNSSNSNFTNINENIKINFKNRTVLKNNDIIQLKPKEYELLEFFVQNRNKVFSREQLIDNVWEFSYDGDLRTVDIHIRRLRSKLDTKGTPSIIETVFSVGYIMR